MINHRKTIRRIVNRRAGHTAPDRRKRWMSDRRVGDKTTKDILKEWSQKTYHNLYG